jgi:hypothetical protein
MARPKKLGLDYFPHDTDAMNDEKLEIMQLLYGNDGYAFYFKILERIYRTPELMLDISDDETRIVMIKKCNVHESMFDSMLQSALKNNLFDKKIFDEYGILTSNGIVKRAEVVISKRQKMRERYTNQGIGVSDAETQQKLGKKRAETIAETPQRKGKESKEKESKVKESNKERESKTAHAEFVKLSQTEYETLTLKHGEQVTSELIKLLDDYKAMTGKKYQSDYRAITTWVVDKHQENQQRQSPKPQASPSRQPTPSKPPMTMAQAPDAEQPFDVDEALKMAAMFDTNRKPQEDDE